MNSLSSLSLIPLTNSNWVNFTTEKVYFFKSKTELDLFTSEATSNVFDDSKLNTISRKKLINCLEENNIANLSLFQSNNLNDFAFLLNESLKSNDITFDWLNNIWGHIHKHFNESKLNIIEHFKLLPKNKKNLYSLKPAKNMIYFYFNPSDDDDDIPNEFIKFIEPFLTNIVIFDDLPNNFIDCSQRKEYVFDLNLNNFPLFIKRIYHCLGNKLIAFKQ